VAIKVLAFDLYGTLLEIGSLQEIVREYTPMSELLIETWRSRQLQLANLATTTGRYVDFDRLTLMALHEIGPRFHLKLAPQDSKRLLDAWAQLRPYPDVGFAVEAAKKRGLRPIVVTNAVESTARHALQHAQLDGSFEAVISANDVRVYKPNAAVYRLIGEHLGTEPDEVVFVSAHDWDASGARQAGFHTIWVQRGRTGQGRPERTIDDFSQLDGALGTLLSEIPT
jgi:2-haloacid dehalogenase